MFNKKNFIKLGMMALTLGLMVLGACSSSPPYIVLEEPMKPDSRSAVVIFMQFNSTNAQIWDGERPVGTFDGLSASSRYCLFWKTAPGAHIFVGRSSNFVHKRINLQAGRTYYIRVHTVPSPPYTTLIVMEEQSKQDYDDFMAKSNIFRTTNIQFDDEWRKAFLAENDGKRLKDIREYLKTAK